jgi:hypothetical protein
MVSSFAHTVRLNYGQRCYWLPSLGSQSQATPESFKDDFKPVNFSHFSHFLVPARTST